MINIDFIYYYYNYFFYRMNYPINVEVGVYRGDVGVRYKEITQLGINKEWEKLLEKIDGDPELVNSSALVEKNVKQTLNTPLHYAALGSAPKEVFQQLLEMGSSKCLKNLSGATAYDIGVKTHLPQDTLALIAVPKEVKQKKQVIEKLEEGLHKVILTRVESLIKKNQQALPQVAFLFEMGGFYYPVPGMYGGFDVQKNGDKGIETSSWIRVCGGSGQKHEIDNEGNVKLVDEGFV